MVHPFVMVYMPAKFDEDAYKFSFYCVSQGESVT